MKILLLTNILLLSMNVLAQKIDYLKFDNKQLKYHVVNENSENQVLMIHGLGDARSSFDSILLPLTKQGLKVVVMDLPGCGENNQVSITFEKFPLLFKNLLMQEHVSGKTTVVGHSMGGLVALLMSVQFPELRIEYVTIEPSLTQADKNFFQFVQEPPIGIGFDKFILPNVNDKGYLKKYRQNLAVAAPAMMKENIKTVFDHFDRYQTTILSSQRPFTYLYGRNSSEIELRQNLSNYPFIKVLSFDNAAHWVHIDATKQVLEYLQPILFENK